jgi:DNA-3-methyladenine glycosylase II
MSFFIHTEADLDTAIAGLVGVDPRLAAVLAQAGRPPLRRRADGFADLASIVVSQQVSTASAKAIWGRLTAALDPLDHSAVLRTRAPRLARIGLSGAKIRTLKAIAKAIDSGELDLSALADMPPTRACRSRPCMASRLDRRRLSAVLPGHADTWPAAIWRCRKRLSCCSR